MIQHRHVEIFALCSQHTHGCLSEDTYVQLEHTLVRGKNAPSFSQDSKLPGSFLSEEDYNMCQM